MELLRDCYASWMAKNSTIVQKPGNAGLCAECFYSRCIESGRGSSFILCKLSASDPRFPKYPRLPVLTCEGYKKKE
jgi:hypothetical protein